ncbi:aminoglycoside 3'-phosphotransferase [Pseudoclavibacter endophyticus]|uniref:Aminoglycoside 3'-phosphotransferase n=2 Tax=Pseudoclavibacter endophyticus TaxID=1778590 RepID=A0A6H9WSB1_9MICO|nr:aminoglycoside 3'-phosphotransferase [Pseudoclavibacter endophyticus]
MLAASCSRVRAPALAGPPAASTPIPEGVRKSLADAGLAGARPRPVWRNTAGGLTFSIASGGGAGPVDYYVKWNPQGSGESLADEVDRLNWLEGRHAVPVVAFFTADRAQEVLVTRALPGESAVSRRWRREPADAMRALGVGLRRLHELPPDECPFDWGVQHRLRSVGAPRESLGEAPPVDRLVVCHGDPCAPNTLLGDDGRFLAHVDLARLGTADRWADLAVMSMSLGWNYADHDEAVFWQAYGIDPDPVRIAYYRRLWNAADEA